MKLTKAQINLLKGIRDGDLTGWHTTISRLHMNHSPNAHALQQLGLLDWSDQDPRIRITPAGLAALNTQPKQAQESERGNG